MEPETYQKFGRGGAGNYYSKKDIQQVEKKAAEDVESQPTTPGELRGADAKQPEFIHSGRGGAGNYGNAPDTAERKRSIDMNPTTREGTVPEGGFYGRGGAGNLRNPEASSDTDNGNPASPKQGEAYEMTVRDVEKGLRAPEQAHLARE
ncbi:MAG: hypothetical protein LQ350_002310 [Teloschistes chrysophthalmus]|nr:MAG: hypothetical protein LQ350_002310 [Niorma chrysophthalma]